MQNHLDCHIALQVKNTQAILQQIAGYEMDLGLIEGSCHHPDLNAETWIEDELAVFCAPTHSLAKAQSVTVNDLLQETWILREQGSGTRLTFDQAMRHHPRNLNIRLELEHTEAIKRAVESGLGIGCISRLALRDAFRRGSLVPVADPTALANMMLAYLHDPERVQRESIKCRETVCRQFSEQAMVSQYLALYQQINR